MMTRRFALSSAFIALLVAHCSGSSATDDSGAPDASADSTLDDVIATDSAPDDVAIVDSSSPDYCAAFTANETTCNKTDACTVARESACPNDVADLSAQFVSAYVACGSSWTCPEGGPDTEGGMAFRQCITGKLSPDGTAQQLAQDACESCVDAGKLTQCEQNFFANVGVELLDYSDTLLTDIDTNCGTFDAGSGGEAGACIATFTDCATKRVRKAIPIPAACNDN